MSESALSRKCMDWLRKEYPDGYYHCVNDRTTCGIPDIHMQIRGVAIICELKVPGKKPTPLQTHNLKLAANNGAYSFWADNLEDFKILVGKRIHDRNMYELQKEVTFYKVRNERR